MTITRETVEHVGKLARLELTDEEVGRFTDDLSKILSLVAELDTLDLSGIDENALALEHPVNFREDKAIQRFEPETLLKNAPHEEEGFYRVPKILEEAS